MDLRIFTEPQFGASYDQQLRLARASEDAGFDAYFRSDHLLSFMGDGEPGPTDTWTTLAGLARDTSRIRLGTLVTSATFRHPGMLWLSVTQVDAMSSGRVELGLGAGWFDGEHEAFGVPFPPMRERFERLEEQLAIITGLWTTPPGTKFDFPGKHYQLAGNPALPRATQQPHPPVIVGGVGAKTTPRLAARFASEFNVPFAPLSDVAAMNARVDDACAEAGRDPATLRRSIALTVCCGRDDAEVARRAEAIGRPLAHLKDQLAGTVSEVVERLGAIADLGLTRVYLQTLDMDDLDQIDLIASEVMPQVR
ncbi:MAG TPA: LLM class F420-dependent oxidoreductase [Frankiaceae bacterium]|jgi:F420-dependent oxidoreductase-like protein|nr:LLM class F420-dependent oxidoreductase [Frankiaceae bacterium]